MALISVTRLRLRSSRFLIPFFWHALRTTIQARRAPGNLDVKTTRAAGNAFWTLTAWEDEASMRAYRNSGPHRRAMPKLLEWCDEASVGHWEQATAELPDWREARRRMMAEGRLSKVKHPSPAQAAGRIAAPENV